MITKRDMDIMEQVFSTPGDRDVINRLTADILLKFTDEEIIGMLCGDNFSQRFQNMLITCYRVNENILKYLKLDMVSECQYGRLANVITEEFLDYNIDSMSELIIDILVSKRDFSEEFIERNIDKFDINDVFIYQDVSKEFIKKYKDKIDLDRFFEDNDIIDGILITPERFKRLLNNIAYLKELKGEQYG